MQDSFDDVEDYMEDDEDASEDGQREEELELIRSDHSNTGFKGVCRQSNGKVLVRYSGREL